MPTFEELIESPVNKILYIGHSGAGKTGSTVALAAAGYNVRILDLDKGVQVLRDFVLNKDKSIYRKVSQGLWTKEQADTLPSRISFVPLSEKMVLVGPEGKKNFVPKGNLWHDAMMQLDDWQDGATRQFGNISKWTPQDVLVVDGLSRLAGAAFDQTLALNGRIGRPEPRDWGIAQRLILELLKVLYSDAVNCHVIMICHIAVSEIEGEAMLQGFPQTIGKALAPVIGQFFNHAILAKRTGQGESEKREILTSTSGLVQLKNPAPLRVKPRYALATGLAEYFRDVKGEAMPKAS